MADQDNVVHKSTRALIILDMLNSFAFDGGDKLLLHARPAAQRISRLKQRAKKKRIPVLYVNDNFGQWRSDWQSIYDRCVVKDCPGKPIAEILRPDKDDYFVLKPKHSGFYSTSLNVLLKEIGAKELIITGIAADICVLFTVHDAHIRDYKITIPTDCVAAETAKQKATTLSLIKKVFKSKVQQSTSLRL